MSQADLAGETLSASYVSLLESGRREPSRDVLTTLAERLGTSVGALLADNAIEDEQRTRLDLDRAELQLRAGQVREATASFDAINGQLAGEGPRHLHRAGLWGLARAWEANGELTSAIATLRELISVSSINDDAPTITEVRVAQVRCYRLAGDLSLAIEAGREILDTPDRDRRFADSTDVSLMSSLAACYQERGDLFRATEIACQALALAQTGNDELLAGRACWAGADAAQARGDLGEARRLAQQAITHFQRVDEARSLAALRLFAIRLTLETASTTGDEALGFLGDLASVREQMVAYGSANDLAAVDLEIARCHYIAGDLERARTTAIDVIATGTGILRIAARVIEIEATLADPHLHGQLGVAILDDTFEELRDLGAGAEANALWLELAAILRQAGKNEHALLAYEAAAAYKSQAWLRPAAGANAVPLGSSNQPLP